MARKIELSHLFTSTQKTVPRSTKNNASKMQDCGGTTERCASDKKIVLSFLH